MQSESSLFHVRITEGEKVHFGVEVYFGETVKVLLSEIETIHLVNFSGSL